CGGIELRSVVLCACGKGETQGQRVAARGTVDLCRLEGRHTRLLQQRIGVVLVERAKRQGTEQTVPARCGQLDHERGLPSHEQQTHVVRQRRNEDLTQPGVQQAKALIRIEREHGQRVSCAKVLNDRRERRRSGASRCCNVV